MSNTIDLKPVKSICGDMPVHSNRNYFNNEIFIYFGTRGNMVYLSQSKLKELRDKHILKNVLKGLRIMYDNNELSKFHSHRI